jgi:imidazolonepropionase-like amidohydrolase
MKIAILMSAALLAADDSFILRNVTIHPVTGPAIPAATIVVANGKIVEFGAKVTLPKNAKPIDGKGLHLYPGLIDSASNVGMSEVSSVRETSDTTELGDFNPQLRAVSSINPSSEHIPVTRGNGITASVMYPGGGIIGGQVALMHLDGWTWEEMAVEKNLAMQMRFPAIATSTFSRSFGSGRTSYAESKRRYDERVKLASDFFEQVRAYKQRKAAGGPNFQPERRLEAMLPVIDGKQPLMVFATRERAAREAMAFAAKEKVKIVLAGLRDSGPVLKEIADRKIPVILGETLDLPLEEDSAYDEAYALPVELHKAGVLFAFGTFSVQFARNLPFQAAAGVAFGLPPEVALQAITINAAKIWGVDDRIGSIEKGKWADLILTDGDPLEGRSQVKQMWIQGKAVSLETRHTKLYEQYMKRQ